MTHIIYKVVRHEDGWAYTVNGAFSESFPTHAQALGADAVLGTLKGSLPVASTLRRVRPNPSNTRTRRANGIRNSPSAATGRRPTSRMTARA